MREDQTQAKVRQTYDAVAPAYARQIAGELDGKPLDRALLTAFCELAPAGVVADVGCGPGHVTRFLAARRPEVVGVDLSPAMVALARDSAPALTFSVASMLDLPVPDAAWAGLAALYSIIHLGQNQRQAAFAEFARVLAPGGALLVAFHVEGPQQAAGSSTHLDTWFGSDVDVDAHFLDPTGVASDVRAAGFTVTAELLREPIPDVEYPSRRAYLLATRA